MLRLLGRRGRPQSWAKLVTPDVGRRGGGGLPLTHPWGSPPTTRGGGFLPGLIHSDMEEQLREERARSWGLELVPTLLSARCVTSEKHLPLSGLHLLIARSLLIS